MKYLLEPKTRAGCDIQANAIWNQYRRDFAGGGRWGFDWPTFAANAPASYARIKRLNEIRDGLPEVGR
jgi:hypothetical protein